jgi:uncharacterized protein
MEGGRSTVREPRSVEDMREGLREDHEEQGTLWREHLVQRIEVLDHPAWGLGHFRRVAAMSERLALADEPTADRDILSAVAWLHDVGTFPGYAQHGLAPGEVAAEAAKRILPGTGFPAEKVDVVVSIVRGHSLQTPPANVAEARILHDADMLDFLGAVGLVRLLATSGLEEWLPTPKRAIEVARQYADEFPGKLVLPTARRVAAKRVAETRAFLDTLEVETEVLGSL